MLKKAPKILLTTHNTPGDYSTYIQLLQTCILKNALSQVKKLHSFITYRRFTFTACTTFHNKLIYMYVTCQSLEDARKVFDHMKEWDSVSWNTIISASRRHGFPHEAVSLFHQMQRTGIQPDQFTFTSVVPAYAKMGIVEQGMDIHQSIIEEEFLSDVVIGNALLDMYAKCGIIGKAHQLFDRMRQRDVFSWTAMIVGYAHNGYAEKYLETFKKMQLAGIKPTSTTFSSLLPACAKMGALEQGMYIHQSIKDRGILLDFVVATALIDMYAKCGTIDKARELFDIMPQRNMVSWNVMIARYAQNGFGEKALETFKQIPMAGVKPNSSTFAIILSAYAKMGALEQGMDIHRSVKKREILLDVAVETALVDMYAKCGNIDKVCELFHRMPQRNVVTWNAMIASYTHNGFFKKALETFKQIQLAGVKSNSTTFISILHACAKMGILEHGMDIHQSIKDREILSDVVVATALLDMYAKCGSIDKACEVFDRMPQRSVIT